MKITRKDLVIKIRKMFPNLIDGFPNPSNIAMPDDNYWLMTKAEVETILRDTWIEKYKYVIDGFDCEDYSLIFHAFVIQERYKKMKKAGQTGWLPFAIGQCWGTKFEGKVRSHAINLAITSDAGIIFIEPQKDRVFIANPGDNDIYFLRM